MVSLKPCINQMSRHSRGMESEVHIHKPSTSSMDGMCFHQLLIQVDVCLCVNDKLRDTYSGCLRVG